MLVEARQSLESLARIPPSKVSTIREGITGVSLEGRPFLSITNFAVVMLIPSGVLRMTESAKLVLDTEAMVRSKKPSILGLPRLGSDLVKHVIEKRQVVGEISSSIKPERFHHRGRGKSPRGTCPECHQIYRLSEGHQCNRGEISGFNLVINTFSQPLKLAA